MKKQMGKKKNGCTTLGCHLPGELVTEILLRLSVKSLAKCRCVCKSWDAITRKPIFITNHMKHSCSSSRTDENCNTVVEYCQTQRFLSKSIASFCHKTCVFRRPFFARAPEYVHVLGQCNGIMCLRLAYNEHRQDLALWNPATREIKVLPVPNVRPPLPSGFRISPSSPVLFGHDPATNDYKVVKFSRGFIKPEGKYRYDHEEPLYYKEFGIYAHTYTNQTYSDRIGERVEVYSLNNNTWKLLEPEKRATVDFFSPFDHVYLNGFCYWITRDKMGRRDIHVVTSFDMSNEVFSEIVITPSEIAEHDRLRMHGPELFIVDGSSLRIGTWHADNIVCRMWAMVEETTEGEGKRWIMKRSEAAKLSKDFNVRLTLGNGDMVVQYFCDGTLGLVDSSNRIVRLHHILGQPLIARTFFCPETLVSLSGHLYSREDCEEINVTIT